jgi:hypothetical protein
MSECIMIAIVGALINMILALIIPCLIKNTEQPLLVNIKKVYSTHKQVIITSSVIVFITIYLALKLTPELGFSFKNEMSLNHRSNNLYSSLSDNSLSNNGFRIVNLSRL